MKILAIESSGASLSIAISENSNIVVEYFYNAGKIHSEVLVPLIEKILKDVKWELKGIDKFAVSCGPGSFTGIRVAMASIKTLAQVLNKPVVSVDTLEILRAQLNIKGIKIIPAIDALRNEVYIKDNKILAKELGKFSISLHPSIHFPKAQTLALMAENIEGLSYKDIEPLYGRKSWAEEKQK